MSANTNNTKTAATSTPAAQPSGSQPDAEQPKAAKAAPEAQGADAENITQDDVLAVLGQLSEGQKTEAATGTENEVSTTDAEDSAAESETETEPAESDESEAQDAESGDDAEKASGDVDEEKPTETAEESAEDKKVTPTQQRINELTARSKTLQEQLSKANERLASFEAEASGRFDAGVLDHVDSVDGIAQQRRATVELHQKLLKSPQGIELPDPKEKGKTVQYDADGVAELLGHTFWLLHDAIPAREQFLKTKETFDATAVTAYPWLKDSRQGAGAQVQAIIQQNPNLRRIGPNYRLVAADALIGQTLREAGVNLTPQVLAKLKQETAPAKSAKAAVVAAAPRKLPPPAPARAGVVPPRITPRTAQAVTADKRLSRGNGNVNDLTASIAAKL